MKEASLAEIYFIIGMFALILVICTVSVYLFLKTYRKEMKEKEKRLAEKEKNKELEQSSKNLSC